MKKYRLKVNTATMTKGTIASKAWYEGYTVGDENCSGYFCLSIDAVENNPDYWEEILDNTPTDGTETITL